MSVIEEIKARIDIVDLVGETVKLRKSGRNFIGFCPFHPNTRTPSFVVFPETQGWHCFGACSTGGDIFTFVMKREGWEFREALEYLARRAGVELQPPSPEQAAQAESTDRLRQALAAAATYYHHLLRNAAEAAYARDYIARRGLNAETVERFQLGYALEARDALRNYLTEKGFSVEELVEAGLLSRHEDGSVLDRFRGRLIIPIRDVQGQVIGFGARALGDAQPKYLNSPQTPLFDKSATLFALDLARRAIREANEAVIVEGYMDAMQAHQAGFANVVAQMGTALTEAQLRLLKRYTRRFILALDPDLAGISATLRGLTVARETLDRTWQPVFDPRGLVRFEGRLQADIRALRLPEGQDPDDLIRADPAAWAALVKAAKPIIDYVIEAVTTGRDLNDPKVKREVAEQIMPLIGDVANPVERDAYVLRLARLLRVDERSLRQSISPAPAPRRTRPAPAAAVSPPSPARPRPTERLEAYCLAALLQVPARLAALDQAFQRAQLAPLAPDDFATPAYREIFRALRAGATTLEALQEHLDAILHPHLEKLQAEPPSQVDDEQKATRAAIETALRLRERHLKTRLEELRFLQEDAASQNDDEALREYHAATQTVAALLRLTQVESRRLHINEGQITPVPGLNQGLGGIG
jgi:DNA primase